MELERAALLGRGVGIALLALATSAVGRAQILSYGLQVYDSRWNDETFAAISAGNQTSVARRSDGTLAVFGYNYWSLTDNYEWGSYTPRFGLYTVDARTDPTLARRPTDGVEAYRAIIGGGAP